MPFLYLLQSIHCIIFVYVKLAHLFRLHHCLEIRDLGKNITFLYGHILLFISLQHFALRLGVLGSDVCAMLFYLHRK